MNLFTPNTDSFKDYYEKGKFLLAWRLMILFGISFLILTIFSSLTSLEETIIYAICVGISCGALLVLYKTKKYKLVYYLLAFSGSTLAFFTLNNFHNLLHIGDFLWLVLIITFTFFGLGVRYGLVVLAFVLFNVIYYFSFSVEQNIPNITDLSFVIRLSLTIEVSTAILSITYLIYQFIVFHKYSYNNLMLANKDLKEKNELIIKQNLEKTTLVQEVHHRVKNNLQIIISLLRLQKKEIQSEEARKQFSEAISRIMVMSLIHQKLYKDESLGEINLKTYLIELTNDINTLSSAEKKVSININSDFETVGLKTIVPLGLLINELVSNSMQHAFNTTSSPTITIEFSKKNNNLFELTYSDNGRWKKSIESYSSFGIELIEILTSQLDGSLSRISNDSGTTYQFNLSSNELKN